MSGTTSDKKWYNERLKIAASDSEWQRVATSDQFS